MGLTDLNNDSLFYPKEVAMRKMAEKRGRDVVEFFNVWRESFSFDWARQRTPVARNGMYMKFEDATRNNILEAKAVPARLEYNVWFWTKDYDKMQQLNEEYIWWVQEFPNLSLNYNGIYPMEMYMSFGEVVDESSTPVMYDQGLYFVMRAPISLEGWIVRDKDNYGNLLKVRTLKKIIISIYDDSAVPPNPQLIAQETLVLPEPPSGEGM